MTLADGAELASHALIVATGVSLSAARRPRYRGNYGRRRLLRRGETEAISMPGQAVYIVGGANSAGQAAMYFARYAGRSPS